MRKTKLRRKSIGVALILLEIVVGIILSVSFFSLYFIISQTYSTNFVDLDYSVMHFLYGTRSQTLTSVMYIISFFGNEGILILLGIVVSYLFLKRYFHELILLGSAFTIGFFLNLFLKELTLRGRPTLSPLYNEFLSSFPSGHAMNSFVFYSLFMFVLFRLRVIKSKLWIVLFSFLIILIGVSRIYLGVHYPSDVLAGVVGGLGWVATVLVIEKTLYFYSLTRQRL